MALELLKEKWSAEINTVTIGAAAADGGTRKKVVKVGGQETLPFLFAEGPIPNRPVVSLEILDNAPIDWPETLTREYKDVINDPLVWAQKAVKQYRIEILTLRLQGAHPDFGNKTPDEEARLVSAILKKVDVPLIILGSGDDAKDNLVLPACAEAAHGEKCLIGDAVSDNYKTLTAACLADGHNIIAESPIDINIAKQLNILITDMGFPAGRIVVNPTIGALGYGLEYAYSIMERARLAALSGDKMMAMPFICFVGNEAWKAKEAKAKMSEFPQWGRDLERGIIWEAMTASALLQAGADILVMRHPRAIEIVKKQIDELMAHGS